MPRKATRSMNLVDDDNDEVLSQYSKAPDSDDRDIEIYAQAVAAFKVKWQKQKKSKEKKFLEAIQTELDQQVDRKQAEVRAIMDDMEAMYQEFLVNYAAIEDKIRDVLVKIVDTQRSLVALSVEKHQESVNLTQDLEEGGLGALKEIKETYQDFTDMVDAFMKI